MDLILVALIFGSFLALALGASALPTRRPVKERLARLADGSSVPLNESGRDGLLTDDSESWLLRLLKPVAGSAAKSTAASAQSLRQRLIEAGYRREKHVVVFMGARIALALLFPIFVLLSSPVWQLGELEVAVLLCTAAAIGWVGPSYYIDKIRGRRQDSIQRGLPDALDLMVVCVEAGFGINQSLAQVSDEFASKCPIIAKEFSLVVEETRAGKSTTEALRALADRTGVSDISSLVALLVQTERFGTSLANALRVHADSMRVVRMQRAEERAQKATLKLILPSTMIFTALLVIFIAPGAYMMLSALSNQ